MRGRLEEAAPSGTASLVVLGEAAPPLSRRDILRQSLGLAGLSPLCCTTPEVQPGDVRFEGTLLVVDLDRARALRRVGSTRAIVDAGRGVNILVACTGEGRYAALDRTCTHGGAMCAYNHRRRTLQCTSLNHAEFDLRGTLLHGRTHGNLRAYEARCRGSRLEIALGAER
jgi:nitrite reductase/ring-hydroxylating ferredoxin subunit